MSRAKIMSQALVVINNLVLHFGFILIFCFQRKGQVQRDTLFGMDDSKKEPKLETIVRVLNNLPTKKARNQDMLQQAVKGVGYSFYQGIKKMPHTSPTYILWHSTPRPKKALKEAMDRLLEQPPCDKDTIFDEMANEQWTRDLWQTMEGMLHTALYTKLEKQVRKQPNWARKHVRKEGGKIAQSLFADSVRLKTITEE
ncbi:hypothetical protein SISNIDRAFT_530490 [Sistotremastrum niveocremeum HHB9708]|uniref:Uncharacterized protein n=1 Tax=Sistotremastrum niveocremeum HHB9708 TaxID=1314777 RepID=A0A164PJQ5_9AGAM|nr:hypothetical protein SISNIDRAFT_530490 [Sistotremastrum niveocremeum HHB9708]